ncbi:HEAT repeat domain-containing protein [Desulforhopalus vacuolatus]|uniref:DVU0298 family protein n=1 Tax=Desulforhopalus vacuolatus TaxID=40414 RepID=UPI0019646DCA|nr:DVU0298 family protein [Desulforhopalus vacuolatus]MBM9520984.1 HEAT repeat domain-containing protein [Desulforhopalus vacuolatus]
MSSRRDLKNEVVEFLKGDISGGFGPLLTRPARLLINPLFSAICHPLERVRWHAVSAFGVVVSKLADENLEEARVVMRRLLWSLNDESGGIGWGAPESMGEILAQSEALRREYLHMLLSYMQEDGEELFQDGNYLELPMLQRALLWGLGRVAECFPELMRQQIHLPDLCWYLESPDRQVAALALRLYKLIGVNPGAKMLALFTHDQTLEFYSAGIIESVKIATLVAEVNALPESTFYHERKV